MNPILRGGVSGLLATIPMSAVMALSSVIGLMSNPPPRKIVSRANRHTGVPIWVIPHHTFTAEWVAAHAAFGTVCGLLYTGTRKVLPGPETGRGLAYGLVVWGANYLAIMPLLHLYPPVSRDRPGRIGTMITAHLTFGLALALLDRAGRGK